MTGGATENVALWLNKVTGVIAFSQGNLSGLIKVLEGEKSAILERLEGSKTLIRLRPGEWEVPGVRGAKDQGAAGRAILAWLSADFGDVVGVTEIRAREEAFFRDVSEVYLRQGGVVSAVAASISVTMGRGAKHIGLQKVMDVALDVWADTALSAAASGLSPGEFDPVQRLLDAAERLRARNEGIAAGKTAPTASMTVGDAVADAALRRAAPAGSA
jgi:hypothetical protein